MKDLEQFPNSSNSNNESEKLSPESEFPDLEYKSEVKNFENIEQITGWFKKEIEELFSYDLRDDNANKPIGAVEYLAFYLAEKVNPKVKNIHEHIESNIETTGDHTEYWDFDERIPDSEVEAFIKGLIEEGDGDTVIDYERISGDITWMKEHIFEYTYYENDRPGSMKYYIHEWDDEGLSKAIQKWLEFIKSPFNNDENKESD